MKVDSIDQQYNAIIAGNIVAAAQNSPCKFTTGDKDVHCDRIAGKIQVAGEGENCASSLSDIATEDLKATLDEAHADYLLVLNQHYLKMAGRADAHCVSHDQLYLVR